MAIGNARCKQAALVLFKKYQGDFFVRGEDLFGFATSSTTYVTALQLTFTPPVAGDYLIIATCPASKTTTASGFYLKLRDNNAGLDYGERPIRVRKANTHYMPWNTFAFVTLSGAQDWQIQMKSVTSGTCFFDQASILALRLDSFSRYSYAESLARDTTTSTTYVDKTTLAFTLPQAQPTLMLSSSIVDSNSNTLSCLGRITQDGAAIVDSSNEADTGLPRYPLNGMRQVTPIEATDLTFKTQYAAETAAMTAAIAESRLFALQLKDNVSVWIKGATILGATIK